MTTKLVVPLTVVPFTLAVPATWYDPVGSFLRLKEYFQLAEPLLPVTPLPVTTEPLDLVIVKVTVAPTTGEPFADTKAVVVAL